MTSPFLSAYLHLERQADEADGHPTPELADRLAAAWNNLSPGEIRWLRNRGMPEGSPFEDAARGKKVARLLASVPVCESADDTRITAEWLESMSVPDRALWAKKMAGVRAPSAETWRQLVEAVKARKTIGEVDELARRVIR
jgi:hypothetical protein